MVTTASPRASLLRIPWQSYAHSPFLEVRSTINYDKGTCHSTGGMALTGKIGQLRKLHRPVLKLSCKTAYIAAMSTEISLLQNDSGVTITPFKFSYCQPQFSVMRKLVVRSVERLTGQARLERIYWNWSKNPSPGENIFAAAMRLLNLNIQTDYAKWRKIPATGPVLIIANHPFGVLDGLTIGYLSTLVRQDVKIMTHSLLCRPREVQPYILPVDFSGTADAQRTSLQTRRDAVNWLKDGHVVVVFPAGGVSTTAKPLSKHAVDSEWHPFIAKLARVGNTMIVPVFFCGQNSRLWQMASHVSYSVRLALLFRESIRRMGSPVNVKIGNTVSHSQLPIQPDRKATLDHLRKLTYELADSDGPDWRETFVWPRHISFN
jgi:putative hemolysin